MYIGLHVKCRLFFSGFYDTTIFPDRFSKEKKHLNIKLVLKIRPVGTELFYADCHDEAHSRFTQFYERV